MQKGHGSVQNSLRDGGFRPAIHHQPDLTRRSSLRTLDCFLFSSFIGPPFALCLVVFVRMRQLRQRLKEKEG